MVKAQSKDTFNGILYSFQEAVKEIEGNIKWADKHLNVVSDFVRNKL